MYQIHPYYATMVDSIAATGANTWHQIDRMKGPKTFHFYNPGSPGPSGTFSAQIAVQATDTLSHWANVGSVNGIGLFLSADYYRYIRTNVESYYAGAIRVTIAATP